MPGGPRSIKEKITRTKYNSLKLIWSFCFVLSSSLCAWYLVKTVQDFLDYETVTKINIKHVDQLPFPIVSICKRLINNNKDGFNKSDGLEKVITHCEFERKLCNLSRDFEYYVDSFYGNCVRFNSGKAMNGSSIPMKYVTNR